MLKVALVFQACVDHVIGQHFAKLREVVCNLSRNCGQCGRRWHENGHVLGGGDDVSEVGALEQRQESVEAILLEDVDDRESCEEEKVYRV